MEQGTLKDKTRKGLAWSSLGNSGQLLIGTFFGIILARLLSPSDYGMMGLLTVFSLLANTIQDSGFRVALANRREVRHEDYNAVFWFNFGVSIVIYFILYSAAPLITRFYQQSEHANPSDLAALTPLARYVFFGFVISALGMAPYAYLFRTLQVKQKTVITLTSLVLSSLVGVFMAWRGFAYWGIATQNLVFNTVNTVLFWYFSKWRPTWPVSFRPLREMFGFSCKMMVTDICCNVNSNLLTFMMGRFYAVHDVGFYNQANQWTIKGTNLLNGIIRDVAQPVLRSVSDERERHKRVFRKMLRFTSFIAFPVSFGLALIARELTVITVTEKWLPSVPLMQILCLGAFAVPIQALCQHLMVSKGRSDVIMWNMILLGVTQVLAVLLSFPFGVRMMVWAFVAVNICWLFVWFGFVCRATGLRLYEAVFDMAPYAVIAAVVMCAVAVITASLTNVYAVFVLKLFLAALLYALLMWICGSAMFRECVGYLLKRKA